MKGLDEREIGLVLAALAVVVLLGRTFGELARRLRQPEVLGEIVAGFLLGPSVVGALARGPYDRVVGDPSVDHVLSAFSWVGALLLLLAAGMEVDLRILRERPRPGALAAVGAVAPSLGAGIAFGLVVLHAPLAPSAFLGVVLGVTAVSVLAKILLEREEMRRDHAQVMLAAGVASEVAAWLLVASVSALRGPRPTVTVATRIVAAASFFLAVTWLGRRTIAWVMRRVADSTRLAKGQVSLVVVLVFALGLVTQGLGLHALLGAFCVGVLLNRAPRTNHALASSIQALTTGLFAPIFFVTAGMRVDVSPLRSASAWGGVALLFAVATLAKVVPSMLGARLGGLGWTPAALVGVGLNVKGGTDIVVAILGVQLGLLSPDVYAMYAVVTIATMIWSPALLGWLSARAPPSEAESARLAREEAEARGYASHVERVLVPVAERALPALATEIVEALAASKQSLGQTFDVTQLSIPTRAPEPAPEPEPVASARDDLAQVEESHENVELTRRTAKAGPVRAILDAAKDHDLVAIGARPPERGRRLSLGRLQDAIIVGAKTDVLIVVTDEAALPPARRRILAPLIALEYSLAAADLAAHVAEAWEAELVIFHAVSYAVEGPPFRDREHARLREAGRAVLDEAAFRARRLGVQVTPRIRTGDRPAEQIVRELDRGAYDLVVLGCYDHSSRGGLYLGPTAELVLARRHLPTALLVSHAGPR